MKHINLHPHGRRRCKPIAFCLFLSSLLTACHNNMDVVHLFDRQEVADQELVQAHISRTTQARLQLEVDAPLIRQYHQPTAKTVYPKGVELRFYDDTRRVKTMLRANYAVSLDDKKQMQARDSVVVIDYTNGDTVYLDDIVWDQNDDHIYSNHPLRAVNGLRITYGDGFVSDSRMENLRILHQRGTIEFND